MRKSLPIKLLQQKKRIDIWVAVLPILFSLFGLLMVFESSNVSSFRDFGDQFHYVRDQFLYFMVGLGGMMFTSLFPYKKYYNLSLGLILITIITLFAVFIPGIGVRALGAHRWIKLANFNFQPAELTKITLIFYLAAWLSKKEKGRITPFLLLLFLVVGLVIIQPDLGTAIIIVSIAIIIYFLSGEPLWHFTILIPILISSIIILAVISPYRFNRLTTFFNPNIDPLGTSYHIRQILITLGSGGIFGMGIGGSRQKYQFLPEATTDSIFAIIGEEFGFIGAIIFIFLYITFLYRIFLIVKKAPDKHGFLLSAGILAFFSCQTAINLGAIVALLPLTGVPLPFISYGGSNLIVSLTAVGIILNINRNIVYR